MLPYSLNGPFENKVLCKELYKQNHSVQVQRADGEANEQHRSDPNRSFLKMQELLLIF